MSGQLVVPGGMRCSKMHARVDSAYLGLLRVQHAEQLLDLL